MKPIVPVAFCDRCKANSNETLDVNVRRMMHCPDCAAAFAKPSNGTRSGALVLWLIRNHTALTVRLAFERACRPTGEGRAATVFACGGTATGRTCEPLPASVTT